MPTGWWVFLVVGDGGAGDTKAGHEAMEVAESSRKMRKLGPMGR